MKREEQIEQKAKELGQKYFPDENNIWARPNYEAQYVESACKEMIGWADEHPRKGLIDIDKVCECLERFNIGYYQIREDVFSKDLITDFRKFLEEQQ